MYIYDISRLKVKHPACSVNAFVACLATKYLPHYLINGTIFEEKCIENKIYFRVSLQLLSEIFFILRTERDMIDNVYRYSCKVPITLVRS
jgi:hypothetical protein